MKRMLFVLLLLPVFAIASPLPSLMEIEKAIRSGNANALATYFDANVEIDIMGEVDIYEKGEAKAVMAKFFQSHQPQDYSQVHKVVSKGQGSQTTMGDLKCTGGTFRMVLYLKVVNGRYIIQEIGLVRK